MLSEAEKKVWSCPELLGNLLLYLDPSSILCLAKVNLPLALQALNMSKHTKCTNNQIQIFLLLFLTWIATHLDFKAHEPVTSVLGKTVWQKLIKQVCHHSIDIIGWGPHQELHKRMEVVVLNYF